MLVVRVFFVGLDNPSYRFIRPCITGPHVTPNDRQPKRPPIVDNILFFWLDTHTPHPGFQWQIAGL